LGPATSRAWDHTRLSPSSSCDFVFMAMVEKEIIPTPRSLSTTKKHGFLNMFKVVAYMVRRRNAKKAGVDVASKGAWKKLVGVMRPLHHQALPNNQTPPHPSIKRIEIPNKGLTLSSYQNAPPSPVSPHKYWNMPSPSTTDGGRSRYASALDLQELDKSDDQVEVVIDDGCYEEDFEGDAMIDARAEEFITNFYYQIKLQRIESVTSEQ
ncbi:cotton fiber protein, partial [Ralstonia pseudosolanacearum]|uniref:cotton fiber protein n=1 Tax=Ralstonia pseudosolanacearum TaxID=1310165 RepID=UPI003CF9C879